MKNHTNTLLLLLLLCCLPFTNGCTSDKHSSSQQKSLPVKKYLDRDEYDPISGEVIESANDTVIFITTSLQKGSRDTIISPLKGVDMDSYEAAKEMRKERNKGDMTYTLTTRGNPLYQLRPDTTGHTYFMERCGCEGKKLNFQ